MGTPRCISACYDFVWRLIHLEMQWNWSAYHTSPWTSCKFCIAYVHFEFDDLKTVFVADINVEQGEENNWHSRSQWGERGVCKRSGKFGIFVLVNFMYPSLMLSMSKFKMVHLSLFSFKFFCLLLLLFLVFIWTFFLLLFNWYNLSSASLVHLALRSFCLASG